MSHDFVRSQSVAESESVSATGASICYYIYPIKSNYSSENGQNLNGVEIQDFSAGSATAWAKCWTASQTVAHINLTLVQCL